MNGNVAWMLELAVQDGKGEELRALMAEMVSATKATEPGTLSYEWSLNADGTVCHLWERYADAAAAMAHIGNFGAKFAERFLGVVTPTRFVLYGSPDAAVLEALGGFGPMVMAPAAGFSR